MSKKIIYLLSLLMALSLVFASCKKNSVTDALGGGGPEKPGNITPPTSGLDQDTGLFNDQDKLNEYATKIVQSSEVAKYANNDYMRNPVMTVIDGSTVFIAYEVRQKSQGSGNDVALTGTNNVDIAYIVSTDSGVSWDNVSPTPNYIDPAKSVHESHGAPIVYNTGDYIIVVASAGIGLSVGTYDTYQKPTDKTDKSWLEYSYAKIDKTSGQATVGTFSEWAPISDITMQAINTAMTTKTGGDFKQYGTHASKGVVADGKLLLPVTVAEFINDGSWANSRWGYIVYELTVNAGQINSVKAIGTGQELNIKTDKTKTTRVAAATSASSFTTLTVSDNSSKLVLYKGQNGTGSTETQIKAGDGSPGILVVNKWLGKTSYNPTEYAKQSDTPQYLISHITVLEGYYTKKLAIRTVDSAFTKDTSTLYYVEGYDRSKSSSIDVLNDGTIVMVAEGGTVDGKDSKQYFINFSRYTQAYLADKMGL